MRKTQEKGLNFEKQVIFIHSIFQAFPYNGFMKKRGGEKAVKERIDDIFMRKGGKLCLFLCRAPSGYGFGGSTAKN